MKDTILLILLLTCFYNANSQVDNDTVLISIDKNANFVEIYNPWKTRSNFAIKLKCNYFVSGYHPSSWLWLHELTVDSFNVDTLAKVSKVIVPYSTLQKLDVISSVWIVKQADFQIIAEKLELNKKSIKYYIYFENKQNIQCCDSITLYPVRIAMPDIGDE
ncbi:hypothetical protein QUH73_17690 [Labilibaculum sp. K2S]|uniref:hypothetical protein n=1 Tax=Labilibaculum sp. K2S TaxID=3056386 RepID=UPI0025A38A81|nr:hypothetical protein [Labilibaculum sp. K2S]MDM8161653.1 hypothetical protein [Labilibaculum sp. K2S]